MRSVQDDVGILRDYWSDTAASFDEEPDHGLQDAAVRDAWQTALAQWLPDRPSDIVDLGCGTGSLSVLMSEMGHQVIGVDLSPEMVNCATMKAHEAGAALRFEVGDVGHPDVEIAGFDVVLARHVLWTLTDPVGTLARWKELLRPGGRMVLIEGRWFDPSAASYPGDVSERLPWNGGVTATTLTSTVENWFDDVRLIELAGWPELWGREVDDERFVVIAAGPSHPKPDPVSLRPCAHGSSTTRMAPTPINSPKWRPPNLDLGRCV